jgi:chemotaxis protein methyltransferase CheR
MASDFDPDDPAARVLDAIYSRYGYDLREYAGPSIRRRLDRVLTQSGLETLDQLRDRLLTDDSLFSAVVDDLTVQVSGMFRDPPVFRTFRDRVVPLLRTYPQLKLWHAGCASGEEVYATAILLEEEGLYARSQIYATDLSVRAIERAREGVYPAAQAAIFADNYLAAGGRRSFTDYHSAAYQQIAMSERLRRNVVFFQHDLVSDHTFGEMQVIFCRNVLIYFGPALRQRVLHKFGQGLSRGGFLCLGTSERLNPSLDATGFAEFAASDRIYRWWGTA